MKSFRYILCAGLIAGVAAFAPQAHAASYTSWDCAASAGDGEGPSVGGPCNIFDHGNVEGTADWPPPNIGGSVVTGHAEAHVGFNQSVSAKVTLDNSNNPYPFLLGNVSASASLSYSLNTVRLTQVDTGSLRVRMNGFSDFTIPDLSKPGAAEAITGMTITHTGFDGTVFTDFDLQQNHGNFADTLFLQTGIAYDVYMYVSVALRDQDGTQTAIVDPVFTIDPEFADLYRLEFGPGITNGLETPLPATLPLLAGGLSAIGLVGWRRKSKAVAG